MIAKSRWMKIISLSLIFLSMLLSGGMVQAQRPLPKLVIAAAADLSALSGPFQQAFPEAELVFSFGSSGMLARQIEAGAPFDIFLSANEGYVQQLVDKGKILRDDVLFYANGRLGIWSKSGNIQTFEEFGKFARVTIAIANPQHAPYGVAAKEALEKAGIWERYQPGIVYAENVRQAVQFADSGNADVTVTAWSLLHNRGATLVSGDLHSPIRQVGAEIRASKQRKLGRRFMNFLTSPEGRRILTENGFFLPTYAPSLKR
jgi:molybdate transport system substrate-binding protein